MDLNNITRLGPLLSVTLNIEEVAGLEVAILKRKIEENLNGKLYLWGKISGTTQDYLIVYYIDPIDEFPEKKYYFTTTSNYVLKAFPSLSDDYNNQAKKITTLFTGDPSFFAYNGEDPDAADEEEDPDAPPVERFREIHRLAYTVIKIDHDCAVVPRGSYVVDATKRVINNTYFQGLSYNSAIELRSYLHFRKPESLTALALLKRPGILKSSDFLDSIEKDSPKDLWVVSYSDSGLESLLRNIYWEGYGFYSVLNSNEFGGAYFGTGVPNYDIFFML